MFLTPPFFAPCSQNLNCCLFNSNWGYFSYCLTYTEKYPLIVPLPKLKCDTQRNLVSRCCEILISQLFPSSFFCCWIQLCSDLFLFFSLEENLIENNSVFISTVPLVILTALVQRPCYPHPKEPALFCMFLRCRLTHILGQLNNGCMWCLALVKRTN